MDLLLLISRSSPLFTAGIYHQDISSGNIMGNFDCSFKVIDFGLASFHVAAKAPGFRRYGKPRCGMIIGQNNTVNVARETRECSSAVGMLTGPSRGGSSITHSGGSRILPSSDLPKRPMMCQGSFSSTPSPGVHLPIRSTLDPTR